MHGLISVSLTLVTEMYYVSNASYTNYNLLLLTTATLRLDILSSLKHSFNRIVSSDKVKKSMVEAIRKQVNQGAGYKGKHRKGHIEKVKELISTGNINS